MKNDFMLTAHSRQLGAERLTDRQARRQADRCTGKQTDRHLAVLGQLLSNCELSPVFEFVTTVVFAQPQSVGSLLGQGSHLNNPVETCENADVC